MKSTPIRIVEAPSCESAPSGQSGGCGLCSTPLGAAACTPGLGRSRCAAPSLVGPPQALAHVLGALRRVHDPECGGNIVDGGLIQSLVLREGEAELTLVAGTSGCAIGNLLAEEAFLAMRDALPDTDVYVQHDRVNPWRHVFSGPVADAPQP